MKPLTEEQRALAGDPGHVAWARAVGRRVARRFRPLAAELESAALEGLVLAAGRFDPAAGVNFRTFALPRVAGAALDVLRATMPAGFRRSCSPARLRGERVPATGSIHTTVGERGAGVGSGARGHEGVSEARKPISAVLCADELPVGWEVEAIDAVTVLSAKLPPKYGLAVRLYYTRAGLSMARVAREVGVSESRVSQMLTAAHGLLRDGLEGD